MQNFNNNIKLIVVGQSKTIKTGFICSFTNPNFFNSHLTTIGVDFKLKKLTIDNKTISIQIWDTADQERFGSIFRSFCRGTKGIILIYSITDHNTFLYLQEKYINYYKSLFDDIDNVKMMLIGDNCENEELRQVSKHEGEYFANDNDMLFFEVNSLTHKNVQESIIELVKEIILNKAKIIYKNKLKIILNKKTVSKGQINKNSCL